MAPDPTPPRLPLFDDIDSRPPRPAGRRPPTAFICYAHETHEHNQHVQDFTNKLRADGVDCTADIFEVSPSEGWARWMLRRIKDSDFVIVVCTATHARHIAAGPASKSGRGVRWEDDAILQCLYEDGENRRFIPVVFDKPGLDHIPQALKSATYYNIGTDAGYTALHRALTNQPRVEKLPLGQSTTRLPALGSVESQVLALLIACPDPLHLELVACVAGQDVARLSTTLQRLRSKGVIAIAETTLRLATRNVDGIRNLSDDETAAALSAALDFLKTHPKAEGRPQMRNVVTLQEAANIEIAATAVSHTFRTIQSFLKSSGNKHLVLEVARRSMEASKRSGRGLEQTKDEAIAAICGVSWVYQRTDRLANALAEAQHSLKLGEDINWHKNTAFCYKCLGRLKRMEAEAAQESERRAALLQNSISLLSKAIQEFTTLELVAEVGDCYSLLARTYLAVGDPERARTAINQADQRLIDPNNKDYLDLQIVKGDLMLRVSRRSAEGFYSEVIAATEDGGYDAQRSEITARAYLHRGRVRRILGDHGARADFLSAAKIWGHLEDPMADTAHWEIQQAATWVDREAKEMLDRESVGVRVRAGRIVDDETARRPISRSRRQKLPRHYLQDVINRAKKQLAVDQPAW